MKKIFLFISTIALTMGLIGFLFNLKDYSFMAQLSKISALEYVNPIDDLRKLIDQSNALFVFDNTEASWIEYIALGILWFANMCKFPIILIQDIAHNVYTGLMLVLYAIGF